MTDIRRALEEGDRRLAAAGSDEPRREAEILLAEVLGRPRAYLFAHPDLTLSEATLAAFEGLLERRSAGEPIAYIRGRQAFWSLELRVTPATLIPRPETELLVEIALAELPAAEPLRVADLGTGCGAIALALASERPRWRLWGVDASAEALAVAEQNRQRLRIANLDLRLGIWLDPLAGMQFDAILSNPPYVPSADPHLGRGDLRFEPREALVSGADGLDAIRAIAARAPAQLVPGGEIWIEHGWQQGPAVREVLQRAGLIGARTWSDLGGQERVTGGTQCRLACDIP